jgi:hypothetical protein
MYERGKEMKAILEQLSERHIPWLRVLGIDGSYGDVELAGDDPQDRDQMEQDNVEMERFWAGRTPAMRHSARVAA